VRLAAALIGLMGCAIAAHGASAQGRPTYQQLEKAGFRYVAKDQPGYVSWCSWIYVRRCTDPVFSCSCGGQDPNYGRCAPAQPRAAAHYRSYCQG
jgi:hypothetical protein